MSEYVSERTRRVREALKIYYGVLEDDEQHPEDAMGAVMSYFESQCKHDKEEQG